MKLKNYYIFLIIGFIVSSIIICSTDDDNSYTFISSDSSREINPQISQTNMDQLVNGNTEFAVEIYKKLADKYDTNIFFSPLSISYAFAMLYAGAEGQTESEMKEGFNFSLPEEDLHNGFNLLDLSIFESNNESDEFKVNLANSLWINKNISLMNNFLDILAINYGAGIMSVDFIDPEKARNDMNQWTSDQTNDKINDIIPENLITPETPLVLINALYFYSKWLSPFDESSTSKDSFFLPDNSSIETDMMTENGYYPYYDEEGFQAIELFYSNNEFSMIIVLPDNSKFKDFEDSLNPDLINEIISHLSNQEIYLSMPKWTDSLKLSIVEILSELNMETVFSPDADFTDITGNPLFISDVLHSSFISVDENGTEAASATAVVMTPSIIENPVAVSINRPFIYMINHKNTGTIIFAGRVLNPS